MHIARHKKERYSFFSCKHHGSLIRYNVRFVRNADIVCQCPINVADEDTSKESTRGRIAGEKRRGAYAESENFFWSDFVLKKLSLSLSLSLSPICSRHRSDFPPDLLPDVLRVIR